MKKIAVLASGSGTILNAIIGAGVPVGVVLADKPCKALQIAADAHIPTILVPRNNFGYHANVGEDWDREGFTRTVAGCLAGLRIDVVAMAGFFTVLHQVIFEDFAGRILNIHPALLPAFPGEFAVRDALAAGVSETGSTVHIATEVLDDATFVLDQIRVPVLPGDDVETLWERIKVEERKLYPRVLQDILSGRIDLSAIYQPA